MRARAVQRVLKRALGHREGEPVLVVSDPPMEPHALAFVANAQALGAETVLVFAPAGVGPGREPPDVIARALASCSCAVLLTSQPLDFSEARRAASGARIASLSGVDVTRIDALLDVEPEELSRSIEAIARALDGARRVRVMNDSGTDLSFESCGRPASREAGDFSAPGAFGRLPPGAARLEVVEGSAEGTLRIDGSISGLGLVREPVAALFAGRRAVEIPDQRLRSILEPHGPDAAWLTGFGIGANPRAALVGNPLEDEKALGIVHLLFGPGRVAVTLRGARIEVDGRPVDPSLLTPLSMPLSSDPGAINVATVESFQILFENSNDPQYILDLDTQRFLEVNPSFERLTGWTREELLSGQATAITLVARESISTFQHKRETRRMIPSERYDLKALTKEGEKRPVEVSVRRITLSGRDVVVGTLRDLSHRKKLEQDMWEKIEELGYANSRIYALTEKIRRVPELTPQLLHITVEEELLERTAQLLCAREGLGYADVNFYLLREDALELVHSTIKTKKRTMKLSADHRLVRVLAGDAPAGMTTREAVLPLKGRERNLGVMEVFFHPKEIEVLQDNERALKGYRDLLETLSNVIGLLVENLHLYEKVKRQSIVDHLTGVYNRRYFDQKLTEEISRASRYGRELSLVLLDVDHFKEINDKLSYKQGDQVLIETGRVFRTYTREVDMVCRYGGDEFAILMPETGYEAALMKAENLRQVVRATEFTNTAEPGKPLQLTLSIGVTAWHADLKTGDELLRAVDEALHSAKQAGRNCVSGNYKGPLKPPTPKPPLPLA